jgi:hypothetical protein
MPLPSTPGESFIRDSDDLAHLVKLRHLYLSVAVGRQNPIPSQQREPNSLSPAKSTPRQRQSPNPLPRSRKDRIPHRRQNRRQRRLA